MIPMNLVNLVTIPNIQQRRLDLAISCLVSQNKMRAQVEMIAIKEIEAKLASMSSKKRKEFYWGGNDPSQGNAKHFKSEDKREDQVLFEETKTDAMNTDSICQVQDTVHDKSTFAPTKNILFGLERDLLLLVTATLKMNTALSLTRLNSSFYRILRVPITPDPKRASMLRYRTSIELHSKDCDDDILHRVMKHASSNLTSVSLTNCNRLTHEGLKAVLRNDKVQLRTIKLDNCSRICHNAICDVGLTSPRLRELYISDNSVVNDVTMFVLADKSIRLETFEINNCPFVTRSGLLYMIRKQAQNLQRLALFGCWGIDDMQGEGFLSKAIASCTKLTTLRVGSFKPLPCGATFCGVCPVSSGRSNEYIVPSYNNNAVTGSWIYSVCKKLPRLKRLDILECLQLYAWGELMEAVLDTCPLLTHLDLEGSQIADASLINVINRMTSMRFLSLHMISHTCVRAITQNVNLAANLIELRILCDFDINAKDMLDILVCCKQLRRLRWNQSSRDGACALLTEIESVNQAHTWLKKKAYRDDKTSRLIKVFTMPKIPTPTLDALGGMQHLPNLEQVELYHCQGVDLELLNSLVPWCKNLHRLTCNFDSVQGILPDRGMLPP